MEEPTPTQDAKDKLIADAKEMLESLSPPEKTSPPESAPEDVKPSVLWHSNAPWVGTGYGAQSALVGPLLAERHGYRVAFSAFYGLRGCRLGWTSAGGRSYVVYPGGRDGHGNDVLGSHAKHWFGGRGGIVFVLTDPWVLSYKIVQRMPMVAWVPIDHEPLIPITKRWFTKGGAIPLAMSRFGKRVLEEGGIGGEDVLYCPHGFSPKIFNKLDRKQSRKALGIPQDAFVIGMVAANKGNPSRKSFSTAIQAFSKFRQKHPDAKLYLHTQLEDPEGENLIRTCELEKVKPLAPDQYAYALGMPETVVAATHSAFDVLLNPAQGEGFGVPLIEAQACGTPCIVTNFSAMPEVAPADVGNWNVDGEPRHTHFQSKQVAVTADGIVAALEEAYSEPNRDRKKRRESVYKWVHAEYTADHVVDTYLAPALEVAEEELQWRELSMMSYDDDDD